MKKRMSKILSMLLISALVVSTGSVVEAADMEGQTAQVQEADGEAAPAEDEAEAVPAEEVKEEVPAAVEKKAEVEKAEAPVKEAEEAPEMGIDALSAVDGGESGEIDLDAKSMVTKPILVKTITTGKETIAPEDIADIYYTEEDVKGEGICGYSQRYDAPSKGVLNIAVQLYSGTKSVYYGIFKDENLTQRVDYSVVSSSSPASKTISIPNAGTYYIGIYSLGSGSTEMTQHVRAGAVFCNGDDRTIKNGQTVLVGQKDAQTNYFKIVPSSTGYLTVNNEGNAGYYDVSLYNSSKKALSGKTWMSYKPVYGVTKGKTYYIRIDSTSNSKDAYSFSTTNKKISEKSGKSKSKAVNVKKNKTIKGTIQAGSSQADWYKLKVTSNKKITINTTINTNDKIKIVVYKGGKQMYSRVAPNNTKLKIYSLGKVSKGTYYVKVQRANKNSSGYYTLKWK